MSEKKRKEAIKTRGYVTLYRDDYQNALQITKGHMFKTLPDVNGKELKFYVLDTTVIGAGEKSGKVLVEAESPGTGYNVSTGKITVSMIHLDGVVSVSNEEGWLYEEGADIEDLEDLRTRAEDAWSELAEKRTTEEKLDKCIKEGEWCSWCQSGCTASKRSGNHGYHHHKYIRRSHTGTA